MQINSRTPNPIQFPELENKSFRESRQIQDLRRKLEKQKETIQELVSLVKESKTEQYKPSFNQMVQHPKNEYDQITLQLLEEVKTLRKQINNIELGPKQTPIPQPLQPLIIPQYLPSPPQQQQMIPPYMYMNPYFPMPQQQMYQQQSQQQKKKEDPYKQLVLQMLLQKQLGGRRRDSAYSDYSEDYDDQTNKKRNRNYSNRDDNRNRNKVNNDDRRKQRDQSNQDRSKGSLHDSYVSKFTRTSQKIRTKKQKIFSEEEKLKLRRKMIGTFWFMRIGLILRKYLKRVWMKRRQDYYENEAQQQIEKFDHEFNYKEVFILFVVECNKNKYFSKNWNFFDQLDTELKCKTVFSIISILFKKLPFLTKNSLSDEHRQFIKQISSPGGFLLPGHPKFVSDRVELRPNVTISSINPQVSRMIQMDYVYIQVLLQRVILIHEWYSQFSKIPNHKEAMKILATTMHQLYIDQYESLPVYDNPDTIYNKQQVIYCDFSQFNYIDVAISIDEQHSKYQPTSNCCILGLGTKDEMQPLYNQPGYKELRTQFEEYSDYFYNQINII